MSKPQFQKAYTELKNINAPVFNEYTNGEPVENGSFKISGESGNELFIVDYYSPEYGSFGVDQRIDDILTKHGLTCEWDDPGSLSVFEA